MVVIELLNKMLSGAAILAVRFYQRAISPMLPPTCRFEPSCSQYMIDAIRKKGFVIGIARGLLRLLRCNPLFPGGYDPVE
jgi:putative membrane protein insertion efficiency factor